MEVNYFELYFCGVWKSAEQNRKVERKVCATRRYSALQAYLERGVIGCYGGYAVLVRCSAYGVKYWRENLVLRQYKYWYKL